MQELVKKTLKTQCSFLSQFLLLYFEALQSPAVNMPSKAELLELLRPVDTYESGRAQAIIGRTHPGDPSFDSSPSTVNGAIGYWLEQGVPWVVAWTRGCTLRPCMDMRLCMAP